MNTHQLAVEYLLPIVVIVVLIGVNALFVTAEFALLSARPSRIAALGESGSAGARWLEQQLSSPAHKDRYIAVAQLGITLASIGLGMYGEHAIAHWLLGPFERLHLGEGMARSAATLFSLVLITFMHIIFGEMMPKALALGSPEKSIVSINPLMRLFSTLFAPMVWLLSGLAVGLMRLLRVSDPDAGSLLYSSKELAIVTQESAEGGEIDELQQNLIRNIFALENHTAEELMTPRTRLQALPLQAASEDIHSLIVRSQRSRFPVYDGTLDNVLGVLHVKDFIRARAQNQLQSQGGPLALRRLLRPLPSVVATETAEDLLALFKRERVHAALVVDEYGGTLGFVTMDDLIQDVIEQEDESWIIRHDDGSYGLDGEVTLSELRDEGLNLVSDDATTIAGLLLAAHGTLPTQGTTLHIQGVDLTAEAVEGLKITRVRLRPVAPVASDPH